jgi:plasmid stabilization system protein ParE
MRLEFHRQVASDISSIMDHYEGIAGPTLADEFYFELQTCFQKAADHPEVYDIRFHDLRRVNLERFPYHFLFRIIGDRVRVLVVQSSSQTHNARSAPSLNYAKAKPPDPELFE